MRHRRIERVAPTDLVRKIRLCRIDSGHRHTPKLPAFFQHVDHTQIGDHRHCKLHHIRQALFVFNRFGQQAAGLRQKAQRPLGSLTLGDLGAQRLISLGQSGGALTYTLLQLIARLPQRRFRAHALVDLLLQGVNGHL
jgi:hypothetical protein